MVLVVLALGTFSVAQAKVTIDYAVVGFANVLPYHSELVEAFNNSQTEVEVTLRNLPGDAENVMWENLAVEIIAGSGPDVIFLNDKALPSFANSGAFADLTHYINRDLKNELSDFFPASVETYRIGSAIYGLPVVVYPLTVYINKDIFGNAGLVYTPDWNLDQFTSMARKATYMGSDGTITQYGLHGFNWWPAFLPFLWMYDGDFFTPVLPERKTYVPRANEPNTLDALRWLEMTVQENLHGGNFSGGTAAMRVSNSSEGNFTFGENWDYAHFPTGPKGFKVSRLSSGGWVMGINSKYKDEAWAFIRFLLQRENVAKFATLSNSLASRRSVVAVALTERNVPQRKLTILEILDYVRPHPACAANVVAIEASIRKWYGQIYAGSTDRLNAANMLQAELEALLP